VRLLRSLSTARSPTSFPRADAATSSSMAPITSNWKENAPKLRSLGSISRIFCISIRAIPPRSSDGANGGPRCLSPTIDSHGLWHDFSSTRDPGGLVQKRTYPRRGVVGAWVEDCFRFHTRIVQSLTMRTPRSHTDIFGKVFFQ
jgi:hypothetical protein